MASSVRTLHEYRTTATPDEVLAEAKQFFTTQLGIYAAFPDREGPGFCTFRGQGTEEIAIAAREVDGVTLVTGSTYLYEMQVQRFFTTLPPAPAGASAGGSQR